MGGSTDANFFIARFTGDAVTGINELENTSGITVYPNPCSEKLTINLLNRKSSLVEITDITGKGVYSKLHTGNTIEIETSFLNEGMYFIYTSGISKKISVRK
jgi:hypothetical protein